jgi:hypothetical protein
MRVFSHAFSHQSEQFFPHFFLRGIIGPDYQTFFQVILFDFGLILFRHTGGEARDMAMVHESNEEPIEYI